MAIQPRHEEIDGMAEVQSLLAELADAHRVELAAQRKLIDTIKRAERDGERQRAVLAC